MVHQMQVLLQCEDASAWPVADPGGAITIRSIKRVMGQPLEKDVKVEHAKLGGNEPQEEPMLSMSGKQRCAQNSVGQQCDGRIQQDFPRAKNALQSPKPVAANSCKEGQEYHWDHIQHTIDNPFGQKRNERAFYEVVRVVVGVRVGMMEDMGPPKRGPADPEPQRADPSNERINPSPAAYPRHDIAMHGFVHQSVVGVGHQRQDRCANPEWCNLRHPQCDAKRERSRQGNGERQRGPGNSR